MAIETRVHARTAAVNGFHMKEVGDFKQFYAWDGTSLEGQQPSVPRRWSILPL